MAARVDRRLRYVPPGGSVGMRANFEFALGPIRQAPHSSYVRLSLNLMQP